MNLEEFRRYHNSHREQIERERWEEADREINGPQDDDSWYDPISEDYLKDELAKIDNEKIEENKKKKKKTRIIARFSTKNKYRFIKNI